MTRTKNAARRNRNNPKKQDNAKTNRQQQQQPQQQSGSQQGKKNTPHSNNQTMNETGAQSTAMLDMSEASSSSSHNGVQSGRISKHQKKKLNLTYSGKNRPRKLSELPVNFTPPVSGKESRMNGCVELPLDTSLVSELVVKAKDYVFSHGLVMRTKEEPLNPDKVQHAPFTLLPSPVPRHCFTHAQDIQEGINVLMYKVANDYDFLKHCLKSAIKNDDFTSKLFGIYEEVRQKGVKQPFELGILRSDYMLDGGVPTAQVIVNNRKVAIDAIQIKQIEINTIASSFGGLSSNMQSYHKHIVQQLGDNFINKANTQILTNKSARYIGEGIAKAIKVYRQQELDFKAPEGALSQYFTRNTYVLFVVQEGERNIYDQRFLEYELCNIKPSYVLRRTITELSQTARLDNDHRLFVEDKEVAVVYYRALYTPNDLKDHRDWSIRLLLERSLAIKCPSVNYQLAGTKKVQQELARPGVVEKYLKDPELIDRIRESFAGQYSLDMGDEGDMNVQMAINKPERYVLKPQREGGGNNIFGEEVREVLQRIGKLEERAAYILMERIHPVPIMNYPVISGQEFDEEPIDMVSELGIFGVYLGSSEKTILNTAVGHILRTKPVGIDEGGVAAGYATIDSPYIIDIPGSQAGGGAAEHNVANDDMEVSLTGPTDIGQQKE